MSEILARVFRNGTLESFHTGSIVVDDCIGNRIATAGDPDRVTFWRSAAKAFQAIPFVASGSAAKFDFSGRELALACASHSGEKLHTQCAASMLEKAGFTEESLSCGAHAPFDEESAAELIRMGLKPNQLHNNCSGKHAAMLAFARTLGADPATYLDAANPVQTAILETISLFTEVPSDQIRIGTDGCSAPNFALPLSGMARAYGKLVKPPAGFDGNIADACRQIVSAKMKYPELVGGRFRLDTKVMKALPGKIVCKVGAEGVWMAGVLPCEKWPDGLAIALKIDDGDDYRARPAVGIELLRRFGVMTVEAEEALGEFSPRALKNRRDIEVGQVVADFELN